MKKRPESRKTIKRSRIGKNDPGECMPEGSVSGLKRVPACASSDIIDLARISYCIIDRCGIIRDISRAGARLIGNTRSRLIGKKFSVILSPADAPRFDAALETLFAEHIDKICEVTMIGAGDKPVQVRIEASPAAGGGICHALINDISRRRRAEDALRESRDQLALITESISDSIWLMDMDLRITWINSAVTRTRGYTLEELKSIPLERQLTPSSMESVQAALLEELTPERLNNPDVRISRVMNIEIYRKDGTSYWSESQISLLRDADGAPSGFIGVGRDITERLRAEEEIWMLKHSIDSHYDGAYWLDADNRIVYVNDSGCRAVGYERSELIGRPVLDISPNASPEKMAAIWEGLRSGKSYFSESEHRRKDGTEFPVEIMTTYVQFNGREYACGFARDITVRKRADEDLERSKREREALLRELFHRTRNNMQVISAMLALQARKENNEALSAAFRDVENRIQSMSLVQKKLYETKDLSRINLREYIVELMDILKESFPRETTNIGIHLELQDVTVLIDHAVPCGMVLNEIVSNVIQYAFDGTERGVIGIRLARNEESEIEIVISDNGRGTPPGFDFREQGRFGLMSVHAIVARQLRGSVEFESGNGTTCRIRFRDNLYAERI